MLSSNTTRSLPRAQIERDVMVSLKAEAKRSGVKLTTLLGCAISQYLDQLDHHMTPRVMDGDPDRAG